MSDAIIEEILDPQELAGLPDYAQLGGRMFVVDGRHANRVVMDNAGATRPMGAAEQREPLGVTYEEDASGPFNRGDNITYALRRVATARGLRTEGGLIVEYVSIASSGSEPEPAVACTLTVMPYEYDVDPSVVTITYEIFRSKPENAQLLYKCATLSQSDVEALTDGEYTDTVAWSSLSSVSDISLSSDGMELSFPPVSYVRAWRGMLVGGGYRKRTLAMELVEGETVEYEVPAGDVTADDIGANVSCAGGSSTVQIESVSVSGGTATVTLSAALTGDTARATIWRDDDVLYISRALPGNIEVYSAENGRLISNSDSGNSITGIGVNGTYAYVFRKYSVDILTGTATDWQLEPFPAGSPGCPPGCRAHATICDRYANHVFYYAGRAGVWRLYGSRAECVSDPIANYIRTAIDHSQDEFCHAVYDPGKRLYWLFLFSRRWRENGIRMPDVFLLYDAVAGAWSRGEMFAGRSGLWRDSSGELVPVIGLPGGVARIDVGNTDGPAGIDGKIATVGPNWFTIVGVSSGALAGVRPGMPVHFGEYGAAVRRMVSMVVDSMVVVYGEIPAGILAGTPVSVGQIRWTFTTPEVGLSGYFDRTLKLETLSLAHRREPRPLPVRVAVTTAGVLAADEEDSQVWEGRMDLSTRSVSRLDGRATGLRGASFQMRVDGGRAPALIKAVRIDTDKVAR